MRSAKFLHHLHVYLARHHLEFSHITMTYLCRQCCIVLGVVDCPYGDRNAVIRRHGFEYNCESYFEEYDRQENCHVSRKLRTNCCASCAHQNTTDNAATVDDKHTWIDVLLSSICAHRSAALFESHQKILVFYLQRIFTYPSKQTTLALVRNQG